MRCAPRFGRRRLEPSGNGWQKSAERRLANEVDGREDHVVGGNPFRLYAKDGDDLGVREPNWNVGDGRVA